ncbi:putative transcription factor C2H2 family [Helianthus annuus]|nr:putative transcription factor C2H2 family [Helianthus annuus]
MASSDDQHTNFKHFCRICKKGFTCGRALGGHMRAHGIGDDAGNLDDEDPTSDWDDKQGNRRMYALRTNPNRLKSCKVCENCGKEFLSWKAFLEHRKCSSDDGESLVSSPELEGNEDDGYDDENNGDPRDCGGWSKRKRSFRAKVGSFNSNCPSSDDEDLALAKCLMELSNSAGVYAAETDVDDPCVSPSLEEQRPNPMFSTAAFMSPFTRLSSPLDKAKGVATTPKGMFECKSCKKVFNSHQALGGHRASHKKVKGCFAARNDQSDDNIGDHDDTMHDEYIPSPKPISTYQYSEGPSTTLLVSDPAPLVGVARRKAKVHKCTICNRIFASGQALGGHKRCHWLTSNMSDTSSLAKFNFHEHIEQLHQRALALPSRILDKAKALELNFPAPEHSISGLRRDPRYNPLGFEVSTEINLHSCNVENHSNVTDGNGKYHNKTSDQQGHEHKNTSNNHGKEDEGGATMEDDEADSKLKLSKLSQLKDMSNVSGNSSSWLQVGITSKTHDVGPPQDP